MTNEKTIRKCSGCAFADFRYNYSPVGSGRSSFLCARLSRERNYASEACQLFKDRTEAKA